VTEAAAALAGRLRVVPRLLRHTGRRLPALPARWRRRLLLLAATLALLAGGYQFWLRDSSFVAVDEVTVTGLSTEDAERVRMALTAAGRSMTTLHVDHDLLRRAVAGHPVVRELEVTTDFPHGLQIHVIEHVPAAIAVGAAGKVPVAGDGTILAALPVEGKLPTIDVDGAFGAERLQDRGALDAAAVAGAAPAVLRARLSSVGEQGDRGLVAELREGPELVFGDATRLRAKWAAAARVLADLEASGASYIDLRLPDRPAAGGLPAETVAPVAPAGTTSTIPPATTVDPAATAGTLPADPSAIPPGPTVPPATTTTPPAATTPAPATGTAPATTGAPAAPPPAAAPTDVTGAGAATAPAP
jgi:cell division protein FtsQ